jgi:alcohol dehydrogenase (cytochrome c)
MKLSSIIFGVGALAALAAGPATAQVTDEMLANPAPGDWLTYGRSQPSYRHSPLTQINNDNVDKLQLAWARGLETGPMQGQPLVHDGVIYMINPHDVLQAINGVTGDIIWEYRRKLPDKSKLNPLGERHRGIALYQDKVFLTSWDNHVVALDTKNGKVVWDVDRGQGDQNVSNTSAPLVANGVLVAQSSCQYSPFGCYVTGHSVVNGEELWRNHVIPRPGEEGDETWGNDFERRWETGIWGHLTYDPTLDLLYYGSSGSGPASEVQRGTVGKSLFGTNTRYAVHPKTGEVVWKRQILPRDNWDMECTWEMMPDTISVNPSPDMPNLLAIGAHASGTRRVITGVPCKIGTVWQLDAKTGEFIWARGTTPQNIIKSIDKTGLVSINEDIVLDAVNKPKTQCPSYLGGKDWPPAAYNPDTHVLFVPLNYSCQETVALDREPKAVNDYNTDWQTGFKLPQGVTNVGRIDAVDAQTGKTLWTYEQRTPFFAPVTSTGSGLLFIGGMDRVFHAIDEKTGKELWRTKLASPASGHPVVYEAGGREYVAIPAGDGTFGAAMFGKLVQGGIDAPALGSALYVFALPEKLAQKN